MLRHFTFLLFENNCLRNCSTVCLSIYPCVCLSDSLSHLRTADSKKKRLCKTINSVTRASNVQRSATLLKEIRIIPNLVFIIYYQKTQGCPSVRVSQLPSAGVDEKQKTKICRKYCVRLPSKEKSNRKKNYLLFSTTK